MSLKKLFDEIPKYVTDAEETSFELHKRRLLLELKQERYIKALEETEGDSPRLCLHCAKLLDIEVMQTEITNTMYELDNLKEEIHNADIDCTEVFKKWRKERKRPGGDTS